MSAVNQTLTGDQDSAPFTPSEQTSEVMIGPCDKGSIVFQMSTDGGITWRTLTSKKGSYVLMTPDPAIQYQFSGKNVSPATSVYVGP